MKAVVCFFVLAAVALSHSEERYPDQWDSVNMDEMMHNKKIFEAFMLCCLDKGKCTPKAKEVRHRLEEALETNCAKCTEPQRKGSEIVIGHLINEEPAYWEELKAKFDPTGKYTPSFEDKLRAAKN